MLGKIRGLCRVRIQIIRCGRQGLHHCSQLGGDSCRGQYDVTNPKVKTKMIPNFAVLQKLRVKHHRANLYVRGPAPMHPNGPSLMNSVKRCPVRPQYTSLWGYRETISTTRNNQQRIDREPCSIQSLKTLIRPAISFERKCVVQGEGGVLPCQVRRASVTSCEGRKLGWYCKQGYYLEGQGDSVSR